MVALVPARTVPDHPLDQAHSERRAAGFEAGNRRIAVGPCVKGA